ncbi:Scaffold-type E3 ligase [Penicillium angulare]|uniref:Defective in cullin neddylation protein n=1 Tax=Penicillium angulare TaxID=116970 RepID=A0A9W9JVN1_9EURO|nr:Scaffold-type E3 ligase [Penicillium angulare]
MPAYTADQKRAISQVAKITRCTDTEAIKFLRTAKWDAQRAVDLFYSSDQGGNDTLSVSLKQVFDSYHSKSIMMTMNLINDNKRYTNTSLDASTDEPEKIGIEGAMKYFGDLEVQLDEIACLGVAELCKCPAMGEFTKEGFVDGWRAVQCGTLQKMKAYVKTLRQNIPAKPDTFRRVYRYCFLLSRMQGQRNVQFEIAAEQWRMFFSPESGGVAGNTSTTPWLDWWIEFLEERGKKPINKDLWEQFEVFMRKSHEDESFGWWNPDAAWPGAVDEFVAYVLAKRDGGKMEVE